MENPVQMRDLSEFCEQLGEMQRRFCKLDNCERTIALYYLMVGLPFANARFLQRALEEAISKVNTPESQLLEHNANDPSYISNFLAEAPHIALSKMLAHIPLLRPGNKEALKVYTSTLRRILSDYIAPTYKIYNECVEILSYVFVHPAFGREDKKSFRHLLYHVLQPNSPKNLAQSVSESSDESVSPNPEPANYLSTCLQHNRLNRRSNSLTPGSYDNWSSQENLVPQILKPRSYSLSNEKSLPLKSISIQTSSSETRLQELQTQNTMLKGIVCWLKSLRLHKYSWVFNNLSYDQMLHLTEADLESMGITKGARHKLLLSIAKLKERSQLLNELETEVMNGGDLICALKKLKGVLQSPLHTTTGENLPSQFIKVMGKVCTQLLMLRQPSDDCVVLFSSLCERAEASDAFTDEQKKRLCLWRGQMIRGNHIPVYTHRHQSNNTQKQQCIQTQHYKSVNDTGFSQMYSQKSSSYPNMQGSPIVGAHRHSLGSTTLQNQFFNMNSQFSTMPVVPCTKTDNSFRPGHAKSTQHNDNTKFFMHSTQGIKSSDIESSLESLCLQMMEHALGP
ncbi:hypothetical protein RI129_007220 [Pyrocoelia pectoralis]|uniref:SAM domain-containing protein n=1 Tax=Pyrocoelia pectoralis TaxID=417401 RepID=A0AAN7V7J8_9COLE